jgi:hypothetical protein
MVCQKNSEDIVKKAVLEQKAVKLHMQKQL